MKEKPETDRGVGWTDDRKIEWDTIDPAERAFLVAFARDYLAGRRMLCHLAHMIVGLGMLAAALAAIIALSGQFIGLRPHP
jgi:hypothetical protein